MKIEIYEGEDGQWYWRSRCEENNEITCSGEGHPNQAKAIRAVDGIIKDFIRTFAHARTNTRMVAEYGRDIEDDGSVTICGVHNAD